MIIIIMTKFVILKFTLRCYAVSCYKKNGIRLPVRNIKIKLRWHIKSKIMTTETTASEYIIKRHGTWNFKRNADEK